MPTRKTTTLIDTQLLAREAALLSKDTTIAELKQQVAALTTANQKMRKDLTDLQTPAHTNDDFASALQHCVDTLQNRLSSMVNPLNDFAVREFKMEANVLVDVTKLGQVQYRFIQPGADVDPRTISKITLDIVPIPKQTQTGAYTKGDFTTDISTEAIVGVGEKYRVLLSKNRLYTIGDLLAAGTRVRSQVELAALLGVDRKRLADWLSQAELLTVRDIDGRAARVLGDTGVTGLDQLAGLLPRELVERFNGFVAENPKMAAVPIDEAKATIWINTARQFVGRKSLADDLPPAPTPEK